MSLQVLWSRKDLGGWAPPRLGGRGEVFLRTSQVPGHLLSLHPSLSTPSMALPHSVPTITALEACLGKLPDSGPTLRSLQAVEFRATDPKASFVDRL